MVKSHLAILKYGMLSACIAQPIAIITCLTTDLRLTADPERASKIPARTNTFVEIDLRIISTFFSSLPPIHSRRVAISYKCRYVHKLLVNRLFKLA